MKDKKSNDIISEFKRKIENRVKLKYLKFKKDNYMQVKWSTIPPISTKETITSHLNSLEPKNRSWDRHKNISGLS